WDYETDVKWAVRIHNNGEFIHAAPWSAGVQGAQNVSHGCVNLTTERAKEYYDSALFGDPVEITGSDVSLSTQDSDISDWVYSWEEWRWLSALDWERSADLPDGSRFGSSYLSSFSTALSIIGT